MDAFKTSYWICVIGCLCTLWTCKQEPPSLTALTIPLSARVQYEQELKHAVSDSKISLTEWDSIGNLAFVQNVEIPTPYRQSGYFLKGRPEVLSFRIPLKLGEIIEMKLTTDSSDIQLFMDFFQKRKNGWYPILKNKKGQNTFHFEAIATETYLLRIQPEFHKEGNYELKIFKNPIYAFPVKTRAYEDVWSFWGDPRDGGKRKHEGIDVFAKRGEPLVAVTKAYVKNVSDKGLGGKQVWLRDVRTKNMIYYAHLHEQLVEEGTYVEVGDTIGLVGNTGNAKTTHPHLHFGIYRPNRGGAVDPLPFVKKYRNRFLNHTATLKPDIIGKGVTFANANFRSKPNGKNSLIRPLADGVPVELLGIAGRWYHVRTLQGEVGFIYFTSIKQLKARVLS